MTISAVPASTTSPPPSPTTFNPAVRSSSKRRLAGGVIGTFVEWYDFQIYGLTAPILALHFFPQENRTAALLGTFAIYAIAFFIRPLGGVFFGRIGDRRGRINVLATTVLLMGAATVATGLLPTYGSIGILAAVLLLVCRLAQGFSAGGETSGGLSYVLEAAPPGRRAYWVTLGVASSFLPSVLGGLLILGLRSGFGGDAYTAWGWRIPFLLGGVLAVVGLWLRRKLDDPEEYTEAATEGVDPTPVRSATRRHYKAMALVMFLVAVQAVGAYILNGYMFSYLTTTIGLASIPALFTNAAAVLSIVFLMPVFGALADRVGRKKLMLAGAAWFALVSYPALLLARTGTTAGALVGQLLLAIGVALFGAGGFVTLLELFPTTVRFTGHAISYNLGYAIFGGTTPLVAAALVGGFGSALAPGFYMIVIAVVGIVVVLLTPETRDVALRTAGSSIESGADRAEVAR